MLVEAYRRPAPPYDAGPAAAEAGATSMIDISDGLLADAGHLAEASGVAIDVHTGSLEVAEPLHAVAAATGADPASFVLGGGDDHALLATFPAGVGAARGLDGHRRGLPVGRHGRRRGVRRSTGWRTSTTASACVGTGSVAMPRFSAEFSKRSRGHLDG